MSEHGDADLSRPRAWIESKPGDPSAAFIKRGSQPGHLVGKRGDKRIVAESGRYRVLREYDEVRYGKPHRMVTIQCLCGSPKREIKRADWRRAPPKACRACKGKWLGEPRPLGCGEWPARP